MRNLLKYRYVDIDYSMTGAKIIKENLKPEFSLKKFLSLLNYEYLIFGDVR